MPTRTTSRVAELRFLRRPKRKTPTKGATRKGAAARLNNTRDDCSLNRRRRSNSMGEEKRRDVLEGSVHCRGSLEGHFKRGGEESETTSAKANTGDDNTDAGASGQAQHHLTQLTTTSTVLLSSDSSTLEECDGNDEHDRGGASSASSAAAPAVGERAARSCREALDELSRTSPLLRRHDARLLLTSRRRQQEEEVVNNDDDNKQGGEEGEEDVKGGALLRAQAWHQQQEQPSPDCVAPFAMKELVIGRYLGSGEFSNVFEVKCFLPDDINNNDNADFSGEQRDARAFLERNAIRRRRLGGGDAPSSSSGGGGGGPRYAVKYLKRDLIANDDPEKFVVGAVDLAREARYLAAFEHPHIVKIRGQGRGGAEGYASAPSAETANTGYFIVLDKLSETMEGRIKRWASERRSRSRLTSFFRRRGGGGSSSRESSKRDFLAERLKIAYDISGALRYLHDRNVAFRDLKPANLGFDVRGDVKLFDFGLAKELPPPNKDASKDTTNPRDGRLMSTAGSLRYMPPEMIKYLPYDLSVDVYGFAIVLWEMLSLRKAYSRYSRDRETFTRAVAYGTERPRVNNRRRGGWPEPVRDLLVAAWSGDASERPSIGDVQNVLKFQVVEARRSECDNGDLANHSHRRSMGSIGTSRTAGARSVWGVEPTALP